MPQPQTPSGTPAGPIALVGQVVVFTGKLSSCSRREAQARVTELGGAVAEDVTAKTTMLVIGSGSASSGRSAPETADDSERSSKVKKAEQVNGRAPGQVRIVSEGEFSRLAGLPVLDARAHQFYRLRDIRTMYPGVGEVFLRYLDKWGLITPVMRTSADVYYGFADLLIVKQVAAELEQGAGFRAILRSLAAEREGQLALDFRPSRGDAQPAKVIALERAAARPAPPRPVPWQADSVENAAVAARHFAEGSRLDDGNLENQEAAAGAYRLALSTDPALVPALVNLANIHYARDESIEAQALYERAIRLEPDCFEAHFNLGNIYHDLGRYAEAQLNYRAAIALNPTYPDAHFYLAVTLEKMGQSADARPHWRAYQQLAPDGEWVELAREFSD